MSKTTKHMPGPWTVEPDPEPMDGIESWSVYTNYGLGVEAELAGRICEPANARLIAATPDLLAELTMLSEALDLYMTRHPKNYGFWVNFQPFLTSARAAIAKARGDQ